MSQVLLNQSALCPVSELSVAVPWGEIRGKVWGPDHGHPVLCLHGWADNCGTFNTLVPLLPKGECFVQCTLTISSGSHCRNLSAKNWTLWTIILKISGFCCSAHSGVWRSVNLSVQLVQTGAAAQLLEQLHPIQKDWIWGWHNYHSTLPRFYNCSWRIRSVFLALCPY